MKVPGAEHIAVVRGFAIAAWPIQLNADEELVSMVNHLSNKPHRTGAQSRVGVVAPIALSPYRLHHELHVRRVTACACSVDQS